MRSTSTAWLASFAMVAFGASAGAQDVPPQALTVVSQSAQSGSGVVFGSADGQSGVVMVEPVDFGRPVLDAPYSAEAVTEVIQTLADGNQIERRTSAQVARDGRGRVRREQHGIAVAPMVAARPSPYVTIADPASQTSYTLNPDQKIAFRTRTLTGPLPPVHRDGAPVAGAAAVEFIGGSPDVRTRSLKPKTIEGVLAEGTETTMTIPPGAVGNRRPIQIVSERWYSPELQVVILTRRSDPRFGDTYYRLTNIKRAEPPASLFEVPPDFRIVDNPVPSLPRMPPSLQ